MQLNLNVRLMMFSIISAIECDVKAYIIKTCTEIKLTPKMQNSVSDRNNKGELLSVEKILDKLDLFDYTLLLKNNPYDFSINNTKADSLFLYFEKLVPVRNRVMHTKPLEIGDRSLLLEIMNEIGDKVDWLEWTELNIVSNIINTDPSKLLAYDIYRQPDLSSKTIHNLPNPEFDDTGFIGRTKEIFDLKNLLINKKHQVISIVGNGGQGKTALANKVLYDLIDDPNNDYEAIIWISLKTKTLSRGEFIEIKNTINETQKIFKAFEKDFMIEQQLTERDSILHFMTELKSILVLDNLETLTNNEIMDFLKEIPYNSKVLITSRHGIGELENRYTLDGMSTIDSLKYFRELSKYYGLTVHQKTDDQLKLILIDLYDNPLSIKWFMTGLYNGLTENQILLKKDDLIEFCMSNVFDKLSESSKKILQLFLITNNTLSPGEIDYYMNLDDVTFRESVNSLYSTNMIELIKGKYQLKSMAKDYLSRYHSPSNQTLVSILTNQRKLNSLLETLSVKTKFNPYDSKSIAIDPSDVNKRIAAHYLFESLEASEKSNWDSALRFIDKAKTIAPNYSDIYKISAFVYTHKNELYSAMSNYETALLKCETSIDESIVLYLYSQFYNIKMNDTTTALNLIEKSLKLSPENVILKIDRSKLLTYLGRYPEALIELDEMKSYTLNSKLTSIIATRYAEIYRREADFLDGSEVEEKRALYIKAIQSIIAIDQYDKIAYKVLLATLESLTYINLDEHTIDFMHDVILSNCQSFKNPEDLEGKVPKIIEHLNSFHSLYPTKIEEIVICLTKYSENLSKKYTSLELIEMGNSITETNKGIVNTISRDLRFGFIINIHHQDIYFKVQNAYPNISTGHIVSFTLLEKNGRFYTNKVIKYISEI